MTKILEMKHIYKQFPGVLANDDLSMGVEQGEVHSILGENGAGKSTLMSILCGLYQPTSGEIYIKGKHVRFSSARDAMAIGIGMVHQHFMLIPTLSVVENCLIGAKEGNALHLDTKGIAQKIKELSIKYNLLIDPFAQVKDLSVGERQRVEIIKALYRGAEILILDEPTSVLTPQETEELFNMLRSFTAAGNTVLFISHKLNEVMEISDRVTVLRLGKVVSTLDIDDCSVKYLAQLMIGRDVDFSVNRVVKAKGKPVLSVQELKLDQGKDHGVKLLDDVTFEVNTGEILGIAGVDGNGQSELVECLTGLRKATSGQIFYQGKDLRHCSTREIMQSDISHIPQDRQNSGLVLPMTLSENFILQDYYKSSFGKTFLNWKFVDRYSDQLIADFGIKTPSRLELAQNLSGGNQQKLIVAREISRSPKLLIAMHPTRGLDVGATEYIHKKLMEQRDEGIAILLVSTELEEIMKLSDRVCVMYEGRIMGIVNPQNVSIEKMGLMMGGTRLQDIERETV